MFVLPLCRSSSFAPRTRVVPACGSSLDRLFDESFDRFFAGSKPSVETRTPSMDVSESDPSYTVVLDIPGATREQLKVAIEGRRVTLTTALVDAAPAAPQAESEPAAEAKPADRVLYRARSTPAFARTIVLPADVDQSASQARFDNGVLTLTLAKKVPRRDATQNRLTQSLCCGRAVKALPRRARSMQ